MNTGIIKQIDELGRAVIPPVYHKFYTDKNIYLIARNDGILLAREMNKTVLECESDNIYVKQIDSLGRIVIPQEYRKKYQLSGGSAISYDATDDGLLIRKCEGKI